MTITGWVQILLYCAIIVAITPPLGAYMTRVFSGEATILSPVLRPVERLIYQSRGLTSAANSTRPPTRWRCCCSTSPAFCFFMR